MNIPKIEKSVKFKFLWNLVLVIFSLRKALYTTKG